MELSVAGGFSTLCNRAAERGTYALRLGLETLRQIKGVETVRLQGRDRSLPCSSRGFISIVSDQLGHDPM
jgi:hypothetical protein